MIDFNLALKSSRKNLLRGGLSDLVIEFEFIFIFYKKKTYFENIL